MSMRDAEGRVPSKNADTQMALGILQPNISSNTFILLLVVASKEEVAHLHGIKGICSITRSARRAYFA